MIHHVRALRPDSEAVSIALMIRARKKRRIRRKHGARREIEIAHAGGGVIRYMLYQPGRSRHAFPLDPVLIPHHQARFQAPGGAQNLAQQRPLRRIVPVRKHGRPDVPRKRLLDRQRIVVAEKPQRFRPRQPARVLRERLRGNADGLHLVAARFHDAFGQAQHPQCILHLLLVARAIQLQKRGHGPHLGLRRLLRRPRQRRAGTESRAQKLPAVHPTSIIQYDSITIQKLYRKAS